MRCTRSRGCRRTPGDLHVGPNTPLGRRLGTIGLSIIGGFNPTAIPCKAVVTSASLAPSVETARPAYNPLVGRRREDAAATKQLQRFLPRRSTIGMPRSSAHLPDVVAFGAVRQQ
jgi:hypothetical protein